MFERKACCAAASIFPILVKSISPTNIRPELSVPLSWDTSGKPDCSQIGLAHAAHLRTALTHAL